jgi:hypothetical protein
MLTYFLRVRQINFHYKSDSVSVDICKLGAVCANGQTSASTGSA